MTKTLGITIAVCVIAFLGVSNSFAQGLPPNGFGTPNNLFSYYPAISRPNSTGQFSSCYWVNVGPPRSMVRYPIVGMPVVVSTDTVCGSGGHSHDASCSSGRPQMELAQNAQAVPTIHAVTDDTGCVNFAGLMPEFAGYVTLTAVNSDFAATIFTPAGSAFIFYPSTVQGENFTLQDYGVPGTPPPSTDPTNPVPYAEYAYDSSINNINYSPVDYPHGSAINNALPSVVASTRIASLEYMQGSEDYVGYEDQIIIWRMSLPWGGTADNGVAQTITSLAYPNWDQTTPYNAGNPYGVEVEITNPSLAPEAPDEFIQDEHAAMYAIWVFSQNGCSMGQYQPSFDENTADAKMVGPAIEQFWVTHQTIHFECNPAARKLNAH